MRGRKPSDPSPVKNIEVSDKHIKLRIAIVVLLIAVAVAAFAVGVSAFFSEKEGWRSLNAHTETDNCSGDFVCYYYLEKGGNKGKKMLRAVEDDYSVACVYAYRIFHADLEFEGTGNLATLNRHPNTEVELDPALYSALELFERSGSRALFFAPVYDFYYRTCSSSDAETASEYDPNRNEETAQRVEKILSYAESDEHVALHLLGENRAELSVSEEYAAFLEEEGEENYLDFFIYKNAMIADYIAESMAGKGHEGMISSFDGCIRSFLPSGETFSVNVFDRDEGYVNLAATLTQYGQGSAVRFKDYISSGDRTELFYSYPDGTFTTPYLKEGKSNSCIDDLLAYSPTESCLAVMLSVAPVYTEDTLDETALHALADSSVFTIWCRDFTIFFTDSSLSSDSSDSSTSSDSSPSSPRLTLPSSPDYTYTLSD